MANTPRRLPARILLAGVAAAALVAAAAHFAASPIGAQSALASPNSAQFTYRLAKLDELVPRRSNDKINDVIAMGADNLFLLMLNEEIVVFRVETSDGGARNRRIGSIPLLRNGYRDVKDIIILDDNRSFLVQTNVGVAVYSVTRRGIVGPNAN